VGRRDPGVDAYLARLPEGHRTTLEALLAVIEESFPRLELRLAWNVPHAVLGSDYVAGFSSAKAHVAFSPWSAAVLKAHRDRLGELEATANLIRIPPGWKTDRTLVRDLVAARLRELGPAPGTKPRGTDRKGLPRRPRRAT
jgi:uncharacterized protein YdhG (YjbR/CyaY superfamily)